MFKLDMNLKLYKFQIDEMQNNEFGRNILDRINIDVGNIKFKLKFIFNNDYGTDVAKQLTDEYIRLTNDMRDHLIHIVHNALLEILDRGGMEDDLAGILINSVVATANIYDFKLSILSPNRETLEYINQIDEDHPFNIFDEYVRYTQSSYNTSIEQLYQELFPTDGKNMVDKDKNVFVHSFTFQTSENCNLNCTYCFAPGTRITMEDYSEKNIEDIEIGDWVLGFEEYNNGIDPLKVFPTQVKELFTNKSRCYKLSSPKFNRDVYVTPEHPFLVDRPYVKEPIWVSVEDFQPGDFIYKQLHSTLFVKVAVDDITITKPAVDDELVYNFETGSHTYIAGGLFVHNCYQHNKTNNRMDFETAKKCIDSLLADEYSYINRNNSPAIILDFIGGDPLLEINLTRKIYEYFLKQTFVSDHPWFDMHRLSLCTNGLLYFDEDVQSFFKDYSDKISFNISIDGNKKLHDSCRVQPNGEGSYDIDIMALNHFNKYYSKERNSKMTLAPENISFLYDSVVNFIENGMEVININCVFEDVWSQKTAVIEYNQLKKLSDYIINNNLEHLYIAIFDQIQEDKSDKYNDSNFCGGTGSMLSIDYTGTFYPCIRYMPSSLGNDVTPPTLGTVDGGMIGREEGSKILKDFDGITRRSQTNDICFECPIGNSCAGCFVPGTLVDTINGPIEIEKVNIGDEVLTQSGKYHKVTSHSIKRKPIISLRAVGTPIINTTKEHPFWTKRFIKTEYDPATKQNKPIYSDPEWVTVEELKIKDKVSLLTPTIGDQDIDPGIAYMVGRWLGDGWREDRKSNVNDKQYPQFMICCSHEEGEFLELSMESYNIEFSSRNDNMARTCNQYTILSKPIDPNSKNIELVRILKECGKYAEGKMISNEIFHWNKKSLQRLIDGYRDADGTVDDYCSRFSTISKKLAYGISTIIRMIYRNPSWSFRSKSSDMILNRKVDTKSSYVISVPNNEVHSNYSHYDENDGLTWTTVTLLKEAEVVNEVHNLSVEEDPTYYADGVLVHNCSAYGYEVHGTANKKTTFICIQNIAEHLAGVYHWNNLVIRKPQFKLPVRHLKVPDEWALLIIDNEELEMLKILESKAMLTKIESTAL